MRDCACVQAEIAKLRAEVNEQKERVRETRTLLQAATNDAERHALPCDSIPSPMPAMPEPRGDGAGRTREGWGRDAWKQGIGGKAGEELPRCAI